GGHGPDSGKGDRALVDRRFTARIMQKQSPVAKREERKVMVMPTKSLLLANGVLGGALQGAIIGAVVGGVVGLVVWIIRQAQKRSAEKRESPDRPAEGEPE